MTDDALHLTLTDAFNKQTERLRKSSSDSSSAVMLRAKMLHRDDRAARDAAKDVYTYAAGHMADVDAYASTEKWRAAVTYQVCYCRLFERTGAIKASPAVE